MADATAHETNSFYSRIFAQLYDPFMKGMEKKVLYSRREALLSPLQGKILDVGPGTGVNLPIYNHHAHVIAAEPSTAMIRKARKNLADEDVKASIDWMNAGVGDQFLDDYILPNELDAVVSTLVLCTIPNPEAAIHRFWHWLRPGGKFILMEHIRAEHPVGSFLQTLATPLWKQIAEGCHLNRPTDQMLKESGFEQIEEEYFMNKVPFYQAVFQKPASK